EIGRLVGYDSVPSFRKLLRGFLGMAPSEYRRRAPALLERAGAPPDGAQTNAYWERMLAGELPGDQARELDDYLGRLVPASAPAAAASDDDERTARLRRTLAEGLSEALDDPKVDDRTLTFAEQRQLVRDAVWFPDGTFFEHLSELSAAADPERGVELAQLALDSVGARRLLEVRPGRQAVAWARLARARWRAGDVR
ncbi:MAG: AraC family transcriptional regulator, partial [Lentisphaerae bacterium]|nr:AraC family transcriptional regulator [Lentisphaerota bacterium]